MTLQIVSDMQEIRECDKSIERIIPTRVRINNKREQLQVPVYDERHVKNGQCARYARLAAQRLFGKEYSVCDAWNRRYEDKIVHTLEQGETLGDLEAAGVLKPGMIIGINFALTTHNDEVDLSGMPARYTHNALYLGKTNFGRLMFAEKFLDQTLVRSEGLMHKFLLRPAEILDSY